MSAANFFKELVEFLPKHVSPVRSQIHSALTFIIVFTISYLVMKKFDFQFDVNRDGVESENEERAKKFIQIGTSFIISIFVADMAFNVSWKIRNRVNKNHATYARWFKGYLQ